MGLREDAEIDLGFILEDSTRGFGWPITVTDPSGTTAPLTGDSGDISQLIDPDTGQAVSGRLAHISLRVASLLASPVAAIPRSIADSASKPWLITFDDINGVSYTFKVSESDPDRKLGLVVCMLELYE